jgi:hypothetical protein
MQASRWGGKGWQGDKAEKRHEESRKVRAAGRGGWVSREVAGWEDRKGQVRGRMSM